MNLLKNVPTIFISPPNPYRNRYRLDTVLLDDTGEKVIERLGYGNFSGRDTVDALYCCLRDLYTVVDTSGKSKVSYIPGRRDGLAPDIVAAAAAGYEELRQKIREAELAGGSEVETLCVVIFDQPVSTYLVEGPDGLERVFEYGNAQYACLEAVAEHLAIFS